MTEKIKTETLKPPFGNTLLCAVPSVFRATMKRVCKTEYKYVSVVTYDGVPTYRAELSKYKWMKCFANLREAALAVDKKLIEKGKKPVNILVAKHSI